MPENQDNSVAEKRLLAADMWAVFNFGNPNDRYARFLLEGKPAFKLFLESILLYKKTIIPTQDYLSLTILVGVLGERAVIDMLEANRIAFLRINGSLAYFGNGGGIQSYDIVKPDGTPHAFCAPVETAVHWALNGLDSKPNDPLLPQLAIQNSKEMNISSIIDEVRRETYADVQKSSYLRNIFGLHNRDLNRLAGVGPKSVRIYGGLYANKQGDKIDEIDIVMSLATTNIELFLAQSMNCLDSSTSSPVGHLIKAKAERSLGKLNAGQSFTVLREIAGIPDLGEAILAKQVSIDQIIKLTQSHNGTQFQDWFHENCRDNPIATAREYANLLQEVPKVQSFPAKIMRFVTTTSLGFIPVVGPVVSAGASAADSFLIEKLLRGSSPKFFIEDIRQLQGKPKDTH